MKADMGIEYEDRSYTLSPSSEDSTSSRWSGNIFNGFQFNDPKQQQIQVQYYMQKNEQKLPAEFYANQPQYNNFINAEVRTKYLQDYNESLSIDRDNTTDTSDNEYSFQYKELHRRKCRTSFTKKQLAILEKEFKNERFLMSDRRKRLSSTLKVSEDTIKFWFQNRSIKYKKDNNNFYWNNYHDVYRYKSNHENQYNVECYKTTCSNISQTQQNSQVEGITYNDKSSKEITYENRNFGQCYNSNQCNNYTQNQQYLHGRQQHFMNRSIHQNAVVLQVNSNLSEPLHEYYAIPQNSLIPNQIYLQKKENSFNFLYQDSQQNTYFFPSYQQAVYVQQRDIQHCAKSSNNSYGDSTNVILDQIPQVNYSYQVPSNVQPTIDGQNVLTVNAASYPTIS